MKIESYNLNKDIEEQYTWEYLYKGLIFFVIGNILVWLKFGRIMLKFTMWFGKVSIKFSMWLGKVSMNMMKNMEKKNEKKNK